MSARVVTIGDATLYHGDCREVMAQWPNKAFDHLITDPPYEQISQDRIGGIKRNDGGRVTERLAFSGIDNIRDDICRLMPKICQGWALLFCTAEGVAPWRDSIEAAGVRYKSPMIWVKPDAMPKFNGQGPALGYENIVAAWCGSGHTSWNGGGKRGVFSYLTNDPARHGTHPTEKPVPLMSELIGLFTNPGDAVVDPFMGSGTTGVSCAKLGRRFVGIEQHEPYFDIACRRIEAAYKQADLFIAPPSKPIQQPLFTEAAE